MNVAKIAAPALIVGGAIVTGASLRASEDAKVSTHRNAEFYGFLAGVGTAAAGVMVASHRSEPAALKALVAAMATQTAALTAAALSVDGDATPITSIEREVSARDESPAAEAQTREYLSKLDTYDKGGAKAGDGILARADVQDMYVRNGFGGSAGPGEDL